MGRFPEPRQAIFPSKRRSCQNLGDFTRGFPDSESSSRSAESFGLLPRNILTRHSIVRPPRLWTLSEPVVPQLLVRSSTVVSDMRRLLCTFGALLLRTYCIAGTITAHHLYLTGDISHVDPLAFCKPIPKTPSDRDALLKAVSSGDPKFFL